MIVLINKLSPVFLNSFLQDRKYGIPKRETSSGHKTTPPTADGSTRGNREKITLWAAREEKKNFVEYATRLQLTQSQTLQYLMSKVELEKEDTLFPDWDNDVFVRNLRRGYEYEMVKRNEIIHKLQSSLREYKEEKVTQARKLRQCYELVQNAVTVLYRFCESTAPIPMDVERGMHADYLARLSNEDPYQYPASSGAAFVRMQACLLGEGNAPARFILGIDENGQKVKFRYYPSSYFVGVKPTNERFAKRSSVWLMEWRKDGKVAELIVALPMQIRPKYRNPMDPIEKMYAEVDKLIAQSNTDT